MSRTHHATFAHETVTTTVAARACAVAAAAAWPAAAATCAWTAYHSKSSKRNHRGAFRQST